MRSRRIFLAHVASPPTPAQRGSPFWSAHLGCDYDRMLLRGHGHVAEDPRVAEVVERGEVDAVADRRAHVRVQTGGRFWAWR